MARTSKGKHVNSFVRKGVIKGTFRHGRKNKFKDRVKGRGGRKY